MIFTLYISPKNPAFMLLNNYTSQESLISIEEPSSFSNQASSTTWNVKNLDDDDDTKFNLEDDFSDLDLDPDFDEFDTDFDEYDDYISEDDEF
ncbi:hypothetical protein [Bernardetia sp. MNP-M8]|uniref:hypothetical protein n=1 Tax=Bernardetia sp. MNP-M8 TaxID=3127470 RepID=UPI0030CE8824